MWSLLGLTLLYSLAGPSHGLVKEVSPGIVGVFSKAAAHKYIVNILLRHEMLQSHLLAIRFPDSHHKGHPDHWIKELHVAKVFVPAVLLDLKDNGNAVIGIRARLYLSAKFFFGKRVERIDIIVDVSIKTVCRFGDFLVGVVDIIYETCKTEFRVAKIVSSSHLLSAKARPIVTTILTASLPKTLCQVLQVTIRLARLDFLTTLDVFLSMGPVAAIQYQLASTPLITSRYYVFELNIILRVKGHFLTLPLSKTPVPLPSLRDNALSFGITQNSLNLLLAVLIHIPVQEFICTQHVFSGALELTNAVAVLFSPLKCPKCPVRSPLKIIIDLVGTKKIILEHKVAILQLTVQISILAKNPSGAFIGLFVLRANLILSVQVAVYDSKLIFSSKLTRTELILVSSDYGQIEISGLVKWIQLLLVETYVPLINESLEVGIPLPSVLHIKLDYPEVQILQEMLVLCV